jgi:hypothetical protein
MNLKKFNATLAALSATVLEAAYLGAAYLGAAYCWSNYVGDTVTFNSKCSHTAPSEWTETDYNPTSYAGPCSGLTTYGCSLCNNKSLIIQYRQFVYGGTDCTTPLLSSGSWASWGSPVTTSYYTKC